MKKIILVFAIIIFLGYCGLVFTIKSTFNISQIKNDINKELITKIQEHNKHYLFADTDIKFTIRGLVRLTIFPKTTIVINDVDIKNVQYEDILIHTNIKKIEVQLKFLDVLKKQITPTKITVSGIGFVAEKNILQDYYFKKEIKKKIVKLENNEVVGVKDKLKNLLTASNNKTEIEDGYKEVEVVEETKYELDNSKAKFMLLDLISSFKVKEFNASNIPEIDLTNASITIMDNKNIQKEFKNVSGKLAIKKKEYKLSLDFILNNIKGNSVFNIKTENEKLSIDFTTKNELKDVVKISYLGDNFFINNIHKIKSNIELDVKTYDFNNLIHWIFSVNSKYYNMFDYKKPFSLKTIIDKNINEYRFKNINIDSEDVKLSGNVDILSTKNNINMNIEYINFDEFTLNLAKIKTRTDINNITIFNATDFSNLLEHFKGETNNTKIKDINILLNIKKIIKQNKSITDSNIDLETVNNNYKVNKLLINFNDIKIEAEQPQIINNLYFNNVNITGNNFSKLMQVLNLDFLVNVSNFNLSPKLIIYNEVIYLMDFKLNDYSIDGDVEYSFKKDDRFLATNINLNTLNLRVENKQTKTLKEKLLWLNTLTTNADVFLNLSINNLKLNDSENMSLKLQSNYHSGYLNIYNIEYLNSNNIKNLKGSVLFNIKTKTPIINFNISIDEIKYNTNLINYVFDIEKYKQLLTRKEVNTEIQKQYWINKLFSIPTWEEINGTMNFEVQNLHINNVVLSNLHINSDINNGVINLNRLDFIGLGGNTELRGKIDLKMAKSMNLVLTETTYDIESIINLFTSNKYDYVKGTIGIGGIIQANGFTDKVFASSINSKVNFIGKDIYVKQFGLNKLRDDLKNMYKDESILKTLDVKKSIFDNSGTLFNDVKGSFVIANGVNDLIIEGFGDGISNKLISKIDNSGKSMVINVVNTFAIVNKIGNNNVPLYGVVTFKEDFANKANLLINVGQIEEYVEKIKETKEK